MTPRNYVMNTVNAGGTPYEIEKCDVMCVMMIRRNTFCLAVKFAPVATTS
jgi:hypothetical protein